MRNTSLSSMLVVLKVIETRGAQPVKCELVHSVGEKQAAFFKKLQNTSATDI